MIFIHGSENLQLVFFQACSLLKILNWEEKHQKVYIWMIKIAHYIIDISNYFTTMETFKNYVYIEVPAEPDFDMESEEWRGQILAPIIHDCW